MTSDGIVTSTYNHGRGVDRIYSINFCLQASYTKNDEKVFYFKSVGHYPSKHHWHGRTREGLQAATPTFEAMCINIERKYPGDVLARYGFFRRDADRGL